VHISWHLPLILMIVDMPNITLYFKAWFFHLILVPFTMKRVCWFIDPFIILLFVYPVVWKNHELVNVVGSENGFPNAENIRQRLPITLCHIGFISFSWEFVFLTQTPVPKQDNLWISYMTILSSDSSVVPNRRHWQEVVL
jgi:hypothetical protein